jgi:hypothetical protein
VRVFGQAFEDAARLGREHLSGGAAVRVFLGDLYYLDGEMAPEALGVVVAAVGGPSLQLSDGDDGAAPDHSMPNSWPALPGSP